MPFVPADARPAVRPVDDRRWVLLEDLEYRGAVDAWCVPAGFQTDFATVPPGLTWLVPTTGRYTPAAVVHDYLLVEALPAGLISARDADGVFRRILRELEVPIVRRWIMWIGVRWGAAAKPARRPGWWRDAPTVITLTLVALPFLAPGLIAATLGWGAYRAAELVAAVATRHRMSVR